MPEQIDYDKVPIAHMRGGVRRYIEHGIPPGHFLTAVFSNDLMQAFRRADDENAAAMEAWAAFVHWQMPNGAHGSPARVNAWIKHRGLEGREEALEEEYDDFVPF